MRSTSLVPSALALLAGSVLLACITDSSERNAPAPEGQPDTAAASAALHGCRPKNDKHDKIENGEELTNPNGRHATLSTRDGHHLDTDNAFFQPLGTNGRACVTCHTAEDGFSFTPASAQQRFEDSCGTDPLFRTNDGSNNPNADVSTLDAKRAAYSLLLTRGLIRIHLPIPATAQFELVGVDDPYGNSTATELSLFRRPLASSNLKFGPVIMWDGRDANLKQQALEATTGHAEGAAPSDAVLQSIVDFESALFTAQEKLTGVGRTNEGGAGGGTAFLATVPFTLNENHPFPSCTTTTPPSCNAGPISVTTNDVFDIYNAWATSDDAGQKAVARGQVVFNTKRFVDPAVGPAHPVTCSNCHNTGNTGGFSSGFTPPAPPFGGIPTVAVSAPPFRAGLPLYTFAAKAGATTGTGAPVPVGTIVKSTDPGMALRSGLWRDMNRFKIPQLRGLSARAPYFHNGMSPTLAAVVQHYDTQFAIGMTDQEKSDLTAFLASL